MVADSVDQISSEQRPKRFGSNSLTQEACKCLLSFDNYRDFLKFFLKPSGEVRKPLSYAEFSRRAGFASRAFPRDVILGARSITSDTLPKFIKGMGLTGEWRDYFSLLVQKDLAKANSNELQKIETKLLRLCLRLKQGPIRTTAQKDVCYSNKVFAVPDLPRLLEPLKMEQPSKK